MARSESEQDLRATIEDPPVMDVGVADRSRDRDADFRRLIDALPQQIVISDPAGKHLYANRATLRYHGVALDTFLSEGFPSQVCHPDDLARLRELREASLSRCVPSQAEVRLQGADGKFRWFLIRSSPMHDDHGSVVQWFGTRTDIDDLKRAEDALRMNQAYMEQAQQVACLGSWAYHPLGVREYLSDEFFRMYGLDPAKKHPTDQELFAMLHPDDRQRAEEAVAQLFKNGQVLDIQYRIFRPDGQLRVIRDRGAAVFENGVIIRFVGAVLDITEQENRTEELRRSEFYLAEGQRLARAGSWSFRPDRICDYWSPELYKILGFDPTKGIPSIPDYLALVHPEDQPIVRATIDRMIAEGVGCDIKKRIVRTDGELRVIRCVGSPVFDSGTVSRFVGTLVDITDQERMTQALRRSEFYLQEGQRLSRSGSWSFTPDGKFDYWSPEAFVNFAFDPAKGIPTIAEMLTVVHPDDRDLISQTANRMIAEGIGCDIKYRILHPERGLRFMRSVGEAVFEDGIAARFIGTTLDITEQETLLRELRQREELLRQSEEQWRDVFENNPTMYFIVDAAGVVLSVNPFGAEELGYAVSELVGHPVQAVFYESDRTAAEGHLADCFAKLGQSMGWELRKVRKDGSVLWVRERAKAVTRANGPIVLIACEDITARKHAQDELQRREVYLAQAQILSHTGSFGWNLVTGEILWSEETFQIFGYKPAIAKPTVEMILQRVHPDDVEVVRQAIERVLREHKAFDLEHRLMMPDGRIKHLHVVAHAGEGESGKMEFVGSVMDVTEQHHAKKAIENAFDEIKKLKDALYRENVALKEEIDQASMFEEIVGSSKSLKQVLVNVVKVAPTDSTVLVTGETGTGKELVARAIHKRSRRAGRAFVRVNCAAIAPSLIASELFGHEKGAFTGATQRRQGRFEMAEGGTIFLDEIGELPEETQLALLRVLQEREFERVGGNQTLGADVRVIAATNRDLEAAIKEGKFRRDLFYRLNVFPVNVPPLRDRRDDIPSLVQAFVRELSRSMGKTIEYIPQATMDALQRYDWPGNIRELRNVIERGMILSRGNALQVELPTNVDASERAPSKPERQVEGTLEDVERRHILEVLQLARWKIGGKDGAASHLGLSRTTLQGRMRKLGIRRPQ
jgi:PAS domain S-box-containing protein